MKKQLEVGFWEYAKAKQPELCPLRGDVYGLIICANGDIHIYDSPGGLAVPANRLAEIEPELKAFLDKGCSFVYKKKKARTLKTLLTPSPSPR